MKHPSQGAVYVSVHMLRVPVWLYVQLYARISSDTNIQLFTPIRNFLYLTEVGWSVWYVCVSVLMVGSCLVVLYCVASFAVHRQCFILY